MTGSGGMGALPSSRLTKILQEKAELLRKKRLTAEQALHDVESRVQLLEQIGITLPESKDRDSALQALVRKTDWEGVEVQAKSFLEYITKAGQAAFEDRRTEISRRGERIASFGIPLPPEFGPSLAQVGSMPATDDWTNAIQGLAHLDELLRSVENEYGGAVRTRARVVAEWAGEPADRQAALDGKFRQVLEPIRLGQISEALAALNDAIPREVPLAVERRERARQAGKAILGAAQDLGVDSAALERALRADAEAAPLDWVASVEDVERANVLVADTLRERVGQTIESLRATMESLRDFEIDPAPYLVRLGESLGSVADASPEAIPRLLSDARSTAEEPVVSIVASLLDAVRPRLVEARRLGRDATEVFAAMNRAREALRLKIFSEALAASQEAIDRVGRLTGDLDTAREQADALAEMLQRLQGAHFAVASYSESLRRIREHLDRVELEPARELLGETLQALGSDAEKFISQEYAALEKILPSAQERGFLPDGAEADLGKVRVFLEEGRLADAGELVAALEVRLRAAAGPYVARRVEELEHGFSDIPDESLVAPVRRLLADTDVNLRVKEDLAGSLESLKKAEREFTAVFAAHASSLVEMLEDERRVLEGMGGAGDEIQRQIDEVQQIFNMGDFVKASRASQEIRTRAHQQQLIRSEETLSHAKLALVELSKMGVDAAPQRALLDRAADSLRAQKYAESYRWASEAQEAAARLRTKAQGILNGLADASALWQDLKQAGVAVEGHREKIRLAKVAYQALDFDGAQDTLDVLMALLKSEQANAETRRLLHEAELLQEDAQRLSVPADPYSATLRTARAALEEGNYADGLVKARAVHAELVQLLRPVLSENLRSLEQDLEVARAAGLEIAPVVEMLGEARRRLTLPVPTGVAEIVESARGRLVETRGFMEHAQRGQKRASEAVNEAEIVHVAAPGARERLTAVDGALARRDYARGIELASVLEREMIQLTYQHVSRTLAGFQGLLIHGRQEGSDTTVAENLLIQARGALEEGRPLEALQLAGRSEAELERVELQVRLAQGAVRTIQQKLEEAEKEGVRARVASEKIAEAQAAYRDRLFPVVLELVLDASDSLAFSRETHRRARDALDSADRQVKEAMELGSDVGDVMAVLDHARGAFQQGDYPEATRKAREAAETSRWSIDRLYETVLSDLRHLLETARTAGLTEEIAPFATSAEEAEAALQVREWKKATDLFQRTREGVTRTLAAALDARTREVEALYHDEGPVDATESAFREQARSRAAEEVARGGYAAALTLLREEESRARDRWRLDLQNRVASLKDRLWVGEKLGLDTTPAMELFSEAQIALDAGKFEQVRTLVGKGDDQLKGMIGGRLADRFKETQTEIVFAQEGLHVSLTDVVQKLQAVPNLLTQGLTIEAAQIVLQAAEELNRRKALHRELMNLHYLIDAALGKASERRLDAAEARKLLDESIRARTSDYVLALEKAREALRLLQDALKAAEGPSTVTPTATSPAFWPFRRPPGTAP